MEPATYLDSSFIYVPAVSLAILTRRPNKEHKLNASYHQPDTSPVLTQNTPPLLLLPER